MQIESPASMRESAPLVGSDELAEGLLLVRASTLKMIRLQLAMERQDRRVALEAVDDLVALDRRLGDYLADVPADGKQLLFRNALDAERAALNREKLWLAGGVIRRSPEPLVADAAPEADWLGPRDLSDCEPEAPRRRRWRLALALPALAAGVAAGAYAVGPAQAQAWLAVAAGALP